MGKICLSQSRARSALPGWVEGMGEPAREKKKKRKEDHRHIPLKLPVICSSGELTKNRSDFSFTQMI